MWYLFCLVNVRRFFAQRNSPFDMGDFHVQKYHAHSSLLIVKSHLRRIKRKYALSSPAHFRASREKIILPLSEAR